MLIHPNFFDIEDYDKPEQIFYESRVYYVGRALRQMKQWLDRARGNLHVLKVG